MKTIFEWGVDNIEYVLAMLGAFLAFVRISWQMKEQAKLNLKNSRAIEEVKLKLDIYQSIRIAIRDHSAESSRLKLMCQRNLSQLEIASLLGGDIGVDFSFDDLNSQFEKYSSTKIELIRITEEWNIVDPRLELFRVAFSSVGEDVRGIFWGELSNSASKVASVIQQKNEGVGYYIEDEDRISQKYQSDISDLIDVISNGQNYEIDLLYQCQKVLLGDLFDNDAPKRQPLDPKYFALDVENFDDQIFHFENNTSWGLKKKRAEGRARSQLRD